MIEWRRSLTIGGGPGREQEVERINRKPILFWVAIPSALFVGFNALRALGISQVPHSRIQGLYSGQPGATVVLVSALAAFAIAIDRVGALSAKGANDELRLLRIQPSHQTFLLLVLLLLVVLAMLGFGWLYIREYA